MSVLDLPWHDVVFRHILPCLTLQNQVQLRNVSKRFREMLTEFFRTNNILDLSRCAGKMNKEAFNIISKDNFLLQTLVLRNAKGWLRDDMLQEILIRNTRLRKLDLTNCSSVSNTSLQVLALNCPDLHTLILYDCHWTSVEGMTAVALNCRGLEHVDITGCWCINDDVIILLALHCKK